MELFGKYAPQGENPAAYPLTVLSEAQSLIGMRDFKNVPEKDLGHRLAPHQKMLQNVEMAYQIITYPILEETAYGSAARELIRDAQDHPNINTDEYPHRKPVELSLAEQKLLGTLTQERRLPFNPEKGSIPTQTWLSVLMHAQLTLCAAMAKMPGQMALVHE